MTTFTNQATLTYGGITLTSNITTGELTQPLTAAKTAVVPTYAAGETLTYVVSLVNSGDTALTDLTVTDDLGGYAFGETETLYPLTYVDGSVRYYADGALQPAPTAQAGAPLVVSGITVPAQGSAMVIYQATVNEFAPLADGGAVVNTATVSGDGLVSQVTAQATVNVAAQPALALRKELTPDTVAPNGQVTYTITVENSGPVAADAADLMIHDTFNPVLRDISVTFNGEPWIARSQYTYDTTSGEFATAAGQVTAPAATFTQDPVTGAYTVAPGTGVLTVTGTI